MLSLIIQTTIISIIFIFLVHHLLYFFKNTLTVPKFKDLVDSPSKKYQHIFDIISNDVNANTNILNTYNNHNNNQDTGEGYTDLELLPSVTDLNTSINAISSNTNYNATSNNTYNNTNTNSMKDELKHFLKKQLSNTKDEPETVSNNNNNYASFF